MRWRWSRRGPGTPGPPRHWSPHRWCGLLPVRSRMSCLCVLPQSLHVASSLSETPSERLVRSLFFSLLPPPDLVCRLPVGAHSVSRVPLLRGGVVWLPPLSRLRHLVPQAWGCLFFSGESICRCRGHVWRRRDHRAPLLPVSRVRRRSDRIKTWHAGYGGTAATWTVCTQPKTTPCWLLTRQ